MDSNKRAHYGATDEAPAVHAEHLTRMVEYYNATGPKYNSWHCDLNNTSSHNFAVREILQAMRDTDSRTLLDVCCGTGRAVKVALDQGYDATGIDVSPHLLGIARRELGIPERRLILGDATSLPFPDGAFDVCCILGALHHTAMPIKLVSEMIRVTRNAIVISDEANGLCGGIKQVLIGLGIFDPVYRLLFRRPPRSHRRMGLSDRDGPTYAFSIEEIIPMLKSQFQGFKCLTFYRVGTRQICSYKLPRLFARQGVLTVKTKRV